MRDESRRRDPQVEARHVAPGGLLDGHGGCRSRAGAVPRSGVDQEVPLGVGAVGTVPHGCGAGGGPLDGDLLDLGVVGAYDLEDDREVLRGAHGRLTGVGEEPPEVLGVPLLVWVGQGHPGVVVSLELGVWIAAGDVEPRSELHVVDVLVGVEPEVVLQVGDVAVDLRVGIRGAAAVLPSGECSERSIGLVGDEADAGHEHRHSGEEGERGQQAPVVRHAITSGR